MAYEGGYGGGQGGGYNGQQRPGPGQQRPGPRGYERGPPPQQYNEYNEYNEYNDGYGPENQNAGHGHSYGDSYNEPNYARAPPPQQDQYGPGPGRGGPMNYPPDGRRGGPYPPRGRGPMGPGPGRGMPNGSGPPAGRGPGRNGSYPPDSDPAFQGRQPMGHQPTSPRQAGFGRGGPFPPFPNQDRRPRRDQEQYMVDQMSGMDLNSQGPPQGPPSRANSDAQRGYGAHDQAPMNAGRAPPNRQYTHDYAEQGRGPPQGPMAGGYNNYDDGYSPASQGPPRHEFGPLARSATMPVSEMAGRPNVPPQRMASAPYHETAPRTGPQRPSTATGNRPVPHRIYPQETQMPAHSQHGYDEGQRYRQPSAASIDDVYDAYHDNGVYGPGYANEARSTHSSLPEFGGAPISQGRSSYEKDERPVANHPNPGLRQTPMLNHAKSQPDLRQPQAAVFEMAGDIPAVPPVPSFQAYQPGAEQEYGGSAAYDQLPSRAPNALSGPRGGQLDHPVSMRPGPTPPQDRNPDGLPAHPAPVRPGLMANSMVNPNDKPPPIRNYGAAPLPDQVPPRQQQQPSPQQLASPQGRTAPPKQAAPPVTPQELEHLRMVIKGNPNDQESALRLAKKLIEASDILVPNLPDPKAKQRARERYLMDSHKILKKLANAQNPDAMFFMADCLGKGLFGHEPDSKEAFTLYQSSAKLGHAAAAYRTAVCCEIGHEEGGGTRKDPTKAIQWYKRAATLGDPPAMYKLGMILLKGLLGQPRNPREAVGWLKRAAERADSENPHALHELALLYESAQPNDAIIRDERYALTLFQQAAEMGYKFSQFRLGTVYEYGLLGCPIDPRQSILWYSRAATQEEHQAELALSGWYLTGSEGVLGQSDTEAYLWARKAAVARLAKAEYAMGYFTEVGIGVPANLEDAKRWYWRAAAQDFPKARERLEDLKRVGRGGGPRQRERISRSRIEKQQEGECSVM
ncbi:hypothetical protein S7711_00538 [Stachybotrys chartarum IBT 7711]|uniref:Uncharacterized protein n=1 Tax=Stachybotrys chartarum (strain CBS 109288 / IBT 7711) TaxID=1280523 RepID=A0A084ATN1_STACB|nr:hypothetical protein S7711_00538 [Stachybotrys chartarum IBT 7711]